MAIYQETHYKCDRCGKDTIRAYTERGAQINVIPDRFPEARRYIYLCRECKKDFKKFMKGNLDIDE